VQANASNSRIRLALAEAKVPIEGRPRKRSPKEHAERISKQGAELKCGCGPWNVLPVLKPQRGGERSAP
jgi:hypothetical protein